MHTLGGIHINANVNPYWAWQIAVSLPVQRILKVMRENYQDLALL